MADRERDLTKVLSNVEQEMQGVPALPVRPQQNVQDFAPPKYRNAGDSFEQIKQDLRKTHTDLEARVRAILEDMKRMIG